MQKIGLKEPFDSFFNLFKVESKSAKFDCEFISIIAEDTDKRLKFLWV